MIQRILRSFLSLTVLAAVALATVPEQAEAQRGGGAGGAAAGELPSIADKTEGMDRMDGFLPLYWDADMGQLWMEIPEMGVEMIHFMGYGAGLGSNDLGLDRGALRGSRIVKFERVHQTSMA